MRDEEIVLLNCYYIRVDQSPNEGVYTIDNGIILGEKENDEIWQIAIDIMTGYYDNNSDKYVSLNESGMFRKSEYSSLWWD